jgi:hypothetical protein
MLLMFSPLKPLKPLSPLKLFTIFAELFQKYASLAQLVEQLIRNEQVVGSSPIGGSQFALYLRRIVENYS